MKSCPLCGKEYSDTTTLCPADAEVLESVDDPLLGQTLAEKYSIKELIKRGGMGAVYRGKHVMMDKTVAIKVLRPGLAGDDVVVARFSREAKAASRISHPHAVSVTDFGESENGIVFLVMEYLDGRTLKDIIKSEGPMPLARVVEIVRQVSGALDAAHAQGVIHRDLKSDNIMLSQTNGGDWAKVLDFGIAKIQQPEGARDNDITAANLVIGTPQYMSPEQCSQSGAIDARSDVYSLGVIVYEMLAGRVPFTGESPTVIMMKQVQDQPPSILDSRPELPASVGKLIERALAKQPIDRFQTAGDLYQDLTKAAEAASEPEAVAIMPPVADTVANSPVNAAADDLDEVTVVRRRDDVVEGGLDSELPPYIRQQGDESALAGFNPWRILAPAAIALIAVFGIVFLLTRGTSQTPTNQTQGQLPGQSGLTADPNGQPVRPTGTPNGESERGIQPTSSATPASRNANANAAQAVPPTTVIGEFGSNDNSRSNNKNSNQSEPPKPKPSPSINKSDQPPPPPPRPVQSVKPVPRASPTPE